MCARFENLRAERRENLEFPNGSRGSPKQLEERFGDIPPHERGFLSRSLLGAIPPEQRVEIGAWASRMAKSDKVDPGLKELLVFYAAAQAARPGQRVQDVIAHVVTQRSADILLIAA